MYILGINAYHGDSSACLLKDGQLVCAQEEERIRRIKHWAGLPSESIKWCLEYEDISLDDIDYIAVGRDPSAHFSSKVKFTIKNRPSLSMVWDRVKNLFKIGGLAQELSREFNVDSSSLSRKIKRVEHHKAHMASAFFVSKFKEAALVTVDGMGDFVSTMWGKGEDNDINVDGWVEFPHSLGYFYTAITQYLGFWYYGDEYKMMGLSAFGKPKYMDEMREIVKLQDDGSFRLNFDYFTIDDDHSTTWNNSAPSVGKLFTDELEEILGPARQEEGDENIDQKFKDIAASAQKMYEEALFHLLNKVYEKTESKNLCFAGGTAQNSASNGKILDETPFEEIYIPSSAHDGGNALGAAFYVWNEILERQRSFTMTTPFYGPEYSDEEIKKELDKNDLEYEKLERQELLEKTAKLLSEKNVVGWFQGRSEWGPRALGNRSILADPTDREMVDTINKKIKLREPFRPFAPTILAEDTSDYFEKSYPAPFMEKVYNIKKEKQKEIPAVTHKDGTGRLQTVTKKFNELYYDLINEFKEITGVPVLLNTSFNENEPIVNNPYEAIDCFQRTDMDVVVLGNFLVKK